TISRISGSAVAVKPSQRMIIASGPCCAISIAPSRPPIRSRLPSRSATGFQHHGAKCTQPWLATVSARSIGQQRGRTASPALTGSRCGSGGVERLRQVGENVLLMLDPDRQPHIIFGDPGLQLLLW